jgi:hypothetical protein
LDLALGCFALFRRVVVSTTFSVFIIYSINNDININSCSNRNKNTLLTRHNRTWKVHNQLPVRRGNTCPMDTFLLGLSTFMSSVLSACITFKSMIRQHNLFTISLLVW